MKISQEGTLLGWADQWSDFSFIYIHGVRIFTSFCAIEHWTPVEETTLSCEVWMSRANTMNLIYKKNIHLPESRDCGFSVESKLQPDHGGRNTSANKWYFRLWAVSLLTSGCVLFTQETRSEKDAARSTWKWGSSDITTKEVRMANLPQRVGEAIISFKIVVSRLFPEMPYGGSACH